MYYSVAKFYNSIQFNSIQFNSIQFNSTILAELLEEAGCSDIVLLTILQDLTGETLPPGSNAAPNARLDVSWANFWLPLAKVLSDIRIFHAQAPLNARISVKNMYYIQQNYLKQFESYLTLRTQTLTQFIQISISNFNLKYIIINSTPRRRCWWEFYGIKFSVLVWTINLDDMPSDTGSKNFGKKD